VDLAASVRARRGRVSWQGVGIDGAGRLGRRIDRILRGDITRRLSRGQTVVLTLSCVAVIVAAIACRQKIEAEPLKPDLTLADRLATQQARQAAYDAARDMTVQDVADAEARVKSNPDDLDTRRKLLWFYDVSGQRVLGWNAMIAARRPHVLWLIEHHPDVDMAVARWVTPKTDPIGYAEAKKLWSRYLTQPGVTPKILGNAARFFAVADKPVAETILLRLQREDPGGPTPRIVGDIFYPPWTSRLGSLYASALVGSDDELPGNVVKSVSLEQAHGPFAMGVRKRLEETTDAELLSQTGAFLVNNASNAKVDFDVQALGEGYMRRALVLDPTGTSIRNRVASLDRRKAERARADALRAKEAELAGGDVAARVAAGKPLTRDDNSRLEALQEQAVNALPEDRRFSEGARQAAYTVMRAENEASRDRKDAATASWMRAVRYAQMVLALAPKFQGEPGHDDAVNAANLTLALEALHGGDVKGAVRSMNEAAKTPSLDENGLESRVVNYLLHAGERESVAAYLERVAPASTQQKDRKLADAAAIRKGMMPPSYQSMYSR
jgi:hypothetical protein